MMAVFELIEGWYNPLRRHSALGYVSANELERIAAKAERGGSAAELPQTSKETTA